MDDLAMRHLGIKTISFDEVAGKGAKQVGFNQVTVEVATEYAAEDADITLQLHQAMYPVIQADDKLNFIYSQVEMPSRAYVAAFGFKGPDQQKPAGVLSGGERNRLNLALTLKQGGNLLLLDEPTNDLDVETLGSLENALLEFPGCAVVISHDRWFLDRVATHILAYEGDSKWFWFEGNFESYEKNKIDRLGADAARPHRATYRKLTRS